MSPSILSSNADKNTFNLVELCFASSAQSWGTSSHLIRTLDWLEADLVKNDRLEEFFAPIRRVHVDLVRIERRQSAGRRGTRLDGNDRSGPSAAKLKGHGCSGFGVTTLFLLLYFFLCIHSSDFSDKVSCNLLLFGSLVCCGVLDLF